MSMMIWNPTNEKLTYQVGGKSYFFTPGERIKLEDSVAKHLLHNLGPRGLSVLEYGCDEKQIGDDGIERNREFKVKQITEYNQRNETRKQTNFPYLTPTKEIKAYAIELGIGLLEPYAPRDEEHEATASMRKEIDELKALIRGMSPQQQVSTIEVGIAEATDTYTSKAPKRGA